MQTGTNGTHERPAISNCKSTAYLGRIAFYRPLTLQHCLLPRKSKTRIKDKEVHAVSHRQLCLGTCARRTTWSATLRGKIQLGGRAEEQAAQTRERLRAGEKEQIEKRLRH